MPVEITYRFAAVGGLLFRVRHPEFVDGAGEARLETSGVQSRPTRRLYP